MFRFVVTTSLRNRLFVLAAALVLIAYGVFMLPSRGELELDYLTMLTQHEVVTDAALRDRSERANRAISIVEAASEGAKRDSLVPKVKGE